MRVFSLVDDERIREVRYIIRVVFGSRIKDGKRIKAGNRFQFPGLLTIAPVHFTPRVKDYGFLVQTRAPIFRRDPSVFTLWVNDHGRTGIGQKIGYKQRYALAGACGRYRKKMANRQVS